MIWIRLMKDIRFAYIKITVTKPHCTSYYIRIRLSKTRKIIFQNHELREWFGSSQFLANM